MRVEEWHTCRADARVIQNIITTYLILINLIAIIVLTILFSPRD